MIDRKAPTTPGPLRRVIDVANVGPDGLVETIDATDAEREALASANGLVSVGSFAAHLRLTQEGRAGIRVAGTVAATVRQTCVVTLEPFDAAISEPIALHFLPERELHEMQSHRAGQTEPSAVLQADTGGEEPDLPDPIIGGRIDIGAVAAEFFTLGLDPYPRKPGASFSASAEEPKVSPFASLARLRDMKDT